MAINAKSYLNAAYPFARSTGQQVPRIFKLHWDNHKIHYRKRDTDDWHECWGTLYPDGGVTLQHGMFYRSQGEMEAAYEAMGSFRIAFLDEQENKG